MTMSVGELALVVLTSLQCIVSLLCLLREKQHGQRPKKELPKIQSIFLILSTEPASPELKETYILILMIVKDF